MTTIVHYHHPEDGQFSLDFVNPDGEVIDNRLETYSDEVETRIRSYDLDEEVYVVYTKTNEVMDTEKIEYKLDVAFADMDPDMRVIVRYLLDVFDSVKERKRDEESVPLDAYKDIDINRIPEALQQVDWSGTVPEVGGQIASNLILCHPLPNANHRTAFSMFEGYVNEATDSTFELPSMITNNYEWQTWVDDFIVDSKQLLTVRRNVAPFSRLSKFGCKIVRRKGGIDITLAEYTLDMHPREALKEYADQHEQRTVAFAEMILRQTNDDCLADETGLNKSQFADAIREKI